jgi:hypothetical protein
VEAYLCRRNGGHLVRIVGPAFDQVCAWATRGVPLSIAFRGIDRHCDRYYAKGPKRRPVRIEFCEADVLDAFDEWRRAVGVAAVSTGSDAEPAAETAVPGRRPASLPTHLDRTIARLTALRGDGHRALDRAVERTVRELDLVRSGAKHLRGEARQRLLEQLERLDAALLEAARADAGDAGVEGLGREADLELAPYKDRMPPGAYEQSRRACVDRLLRERFSLPTVSFV